MELQTFVSRFAEQFEDTDPSVFTPETTFHDLDEWSSIVALSVIAFVSEECKKDITLAEMRSCNTIEDLYNVVKDK